MALLVGCLLLVATPATAQGKGKPGDDTSNPKCTVLFANTGVEAIVDDGRGIYSDGVDGTTCTVLRSDGSGTSGDFLFTLNAKKGVKTSRSALLYLDEPVAGSVSQGVWVVGGMFHLKIKQLGDIPVGQTVLHRASFHVPYLDENYKFRYGWDPGDGTPLTSITRHSSTLWTIRSVDTHVARLWTGGSYGDGTVYEQVGDYVAPFEMTITLK
jgi:hypothetical protein